jgi:hypothetical protein
LICPPIIHQCATNLLSSFLIALHINLNFFNYDTIQTIIKDLLEVPGGPIIRSSAEKLKKTFNGLITVFESGYISRRLHIQQVMIRP